MQGTEQSERRAPGAGEEPRRPRDVARFVEKPPAEEAEALARAGGVWNSFILVARARTIVDLVTRREPGLVEGLRAAIGRPSGERAAALADLYRTLPVSDFSRHLLQGAEDRLALLRVPPCGWSDLGTPERLLRYAVRRAAMPGAPAPAPRSPAAPRRRRHREVPVDPRPAIALI